MKDKTVQELMGVQQEANECKEKVDLKKTEKEIFESNHKQAQDAVKECEEKIKEHEEDLEWGEKRVVEIEKRQEELMEVRGKQKEVERLQERKTEIKKEMTKLQSNLQEIRHNRQNNQSRGRVCKLLVLIRLGHLNVESKLSLKQWIIKQSPSKLS